MIEHHPANPEREYIYEEQLAPLGVVELSSAEYVKRVEQVKAVFYWFDDVSDRALEINKSSRYSDDEHKVFSILPIEKVGQVHAVMPQDGYLALLDERRHRAKSFVGHYDLAHTPYWTEVAVARQERRLTDDLMASTLGMIDEDERYAANFEHSADNFRRNLLNYVNQVEGLTRLQAFDGLGPHFDRLDRYWQGQDGEHYFDWLNHEDQLADSVLADFRRPARQSFKPDIVNLNDDLSNLESETTPSSQQLQTNKKFFDLLDQARARWLTNQIDSYESDQNLPGEALSLNFGEAGNRRLREQGIDELVSRELYRQINLVTDPQIQRQLHYKLYWLQPSERKQAYAELTEVAPLFNTSDSGRLWQNALLRGELKSDNSLIISQREKIRERVGKSEGFKLPSALERLVEQFELTPGSGPLRQLTNFSLNEGNLRQGGLAILLQSERHLPDLRALGEFEFDDVVKCFNSLALAAAKQGEHSLMLRFMFETAVLTGEKKDHKAYLEAELQFQSSITPSDEEALARRAIQYAFDWTDFFTAESEYRKQKHILTPEQRIDLGLQRLRLAINYGYEQDNADAIVHEINKSYEALDLDATTESKRAALRRYHPLMLYQAIISPSPRQLAMDELPRS